MPRNMPYVADFDPRTPSIARVYDYLAGGMDNFPADRELAQHLTQVFPPIVVTVQENKQFLERAVTWLANQGVRQFIDDHRPQGGAGDLDAEPFLRALVHELGI